MQVYDGQCSISDSRVLGLVAGRTHTFSFTFPAGQQHVGSQIKVIGVSMLLGQPDYEGPPNKPLLQLNWTAASLGTQFFRLAWDPIPSRAIKQQRELEFKELPYRLTANIVHREARMAVVWSLEGPALVGELLPIRIQLVNNEAGDIGNVKLSLSTAVPNSEFSSRNQLKKNPQKNTKLIFFFFFLLCFCVLSVSSCDNARSVNRGRSHVGRHDGRSSGEVGRLAKRRAVREGR